MMAAANLYGTVQNMHEQANEYIGTDKLGQRIAGYVGRGAVNAFRSVSGRARGASRKARITEVDLPRKKKEMAKSMKKQGVVNALAGRASMKKGNMKALKNVKKIKGVKVPKKLRKQIKQVLNTDRAVGTLRTLRTSTIGDLTTSVGGYGQGDYLGLQTLPANQIYQASPRSSGGFNSSNNLSWWGCGVQAGAGILPGNYDFGGAYVYFNPGKVLDAASVLWNKKVAATAGWIQDIGNISTRIDATTGVLDEGRKKNLKILVKNSYASFLLKNNSQRAMKIYCYYFTSKKMWADRSPLTAYVEAVNEALNTNGQYQTNQTGNNIPITNPLLKPQQMKGFNANWKTSVTEMIIKPGEECTHSLAGPKNVEYDFGKYYVNDRDYSIGYHKGTVFVYFACIPDLQIGNPALAGVNNRSSRYVKQVDALMHEISVEVVESYKLSCPDVVGFLKNSGGVATSQTLNQKVDRLALYNYSTADPDETAVMYSGFDEQQPGTAMTDQ